MVVKPQIDRFDQYIPYPQYLKLLLRATDATTSGIKDFSGYARPVTNSTGATGSTTQIKINPYSMYFDGTDDHVTVPYSTDFYFSTGKWTMLFWLYPTNNTIQHQDFYSRETDGSNRISIRVNTTGTISFYQQTAGNAINFSTTGTINFNNWNSIILYEDENTYGISINGITETTTSTYRPGDYTSVVNIGKTTPTIGGNFYYGYIDSIAIWKGIAIPISQLYPQMKPFSFRRA